MEHLEDRAQRSPSAANWDATKISVSCCGETLAVAVLGGERERTEDEPLRQILTRILADEIGHARFGWRLLADVASAMDEGMRRRLSALPGDRLRARRRILHECLETPAASFAALALGAADGPLAWRTFLDTLRDATLPASSATASAPAGPSTAPATAGASPSPRSGGAEQRRGSPQARSSRLLVTALRDHLMRMRWWVFLPWLSSAACAPPPPPPSRAIPAATAQPPSLPSPCRVSETFRARVPGLTAAGRLDRALRVLAHADALCPTDAARSRVTRAELTALLNAPDADGELLLAQALSVEDAVASQRLLDRARHALEKAAGKPAVPILPLLSGGPPTGVALDHDGRTLAVTRGRSVALVDVASMREVRRLTAPAAVRTVSFSSAGALATGHDDHSLTVWNAGTGAVLHAFTGQQGEAVFAPDGSSLATAATTGEVTLRRVSSGETLKTFDAKHEDGSLLAFSADGALLAVTHPGPDATADVWEVASGTMQRRLPFQAGMGLVYPLFSTRGDTLRGVASIGTVVTATSVATGAAAKSYALAGAAPVTYFSLALAPKNQLALIGGPRLELWDAASGKRSTELADSEDWNDRSLGAFSGDGQRVAATVRDGSVRVWTVSTGAPLGTLAAAPEIRSVALSSALATAAMDGMVRVIEPSGVRSVAAHSHAFLVSFSPDGQRLVSFGTGGKMPGYNAQLWDVASGTRRHAPLELASTVDAVHFLAKSSTIQLSTTYGVIVWEPSTGNQETKLDTAQSRFPVRPAFSSDGAWLAAADSHRDVRVWDVNDEATLFALDQGSQVTAVALSPDDRRLATSANDNTVRVYDLTTTAGREVLRLHDSSGPALALAFLDDGETLVGGVGDALVSWSLADGSELARVPQASVRRLSARGRTLAWVRADGGVRLSTTDPAGPIAEIASHPASSAVFVLTPAGFEIIGPDVEQALEHVRCLVGTEAYPPALCRERFEQRGLLRALLRGVSPPTTP